MYRNKEISIPRGIEEKNDRHLLGSKWAKIFKKMKNYDVIKILNFWKFYDIYGSKIDINSLNS